MPLMAGKRSARPLARRSRNPIRVRDRLDAATRNAIALNTTMKILSQAGVKLSKLAITLDILWLHEVGNELNNLAHELSQRYSDVDAGIVSTVSIHDNFTK